MIVSGAILAAGLIASATTANAGCVKKAAEATAESASSAKWYAMETMVQSVSWGLWPAYVANGSVPGYVIKNKRHRCKPASAGVSCKMQATFCTK